MNGLIRSRKFWLMVTAVVTAAGGAVTGEITWAQAITATITALLVNIGAITAEDVASKSGSNAK